MVFSVRKGSLLLLPGLILVLLATQSVATAPAVPNPVLYFLGTESFQAGGKSFVRYRYDVLNKADYPADFFAAAPELPPWARTPRHLELGWTSTISAENGFTDFVR